MADHEEDDQVTVDNDVSTIVRLDGQFVPAASAPERSSSAACDPHRGSGSPDAERDAALPLILPRQETCQVGSDRERGDRVAHERIPDGDRLRAEGRDVRGEREEPEAEDGEQSTMMSARWRTTAKRWSRYAAPTPMPTNTRPWTNV
jgi:hypothetical protein